MRYVLSLIMITVVLFSACSTDDVPIAPSSSDQTHLAPFSSQPVPFKGQFSGVANTVGTTYTQTYALLDVVLNGSGNLTHLGLFTPSGHMYVKWPYAPPLQGETTANGSFIAANGDAVHFTATGTFHTAYPIEKVNYMLSNYTITGGTGRFANATGSGTFDCEEELLDLGGAHNYSVTIDGTIQY